MGIERLFGATILLGFFGGGVVCILLWNLLHLILHRKLEKVLLRESYYSPGEIGFFSAWPFLLVITSAYILLTTIPAIPRMNRFATFDEPLPTNIFLQVLCWLMLLFTAIAAVSAMTVIIFPLFFSKAQP